MPYKYVVDVNSKPFAEAPTPVLNALHRLTWAGQKTVNDGTFLPFNELLTLGYFEQQKIGVSKLKQHSSSSISVLTLSSFMTTGSQPSGRLSQPCPLVAKRK